MSRLRIIFYIFLVNQITLMVISMYTMYKYHLYLQEHAQYMKEHAEHVTELRELVYKVCKTSENHISANLVKYEKESANWWWRNMASFWTLLTIGEPCKNGLFAIITWIKNNIVI